MQDEKRFLWAALACFALAAFFLALILVAGCSLKSQQIGYASLQGADVVSTEYAESRGAVEANPVMQTNLPSRIALKAASTVGVIYLTTKLEQMGHKKLSKGLLYALNGLMVGIVANNWRVAQ